MKKIKNYFINMGHNIKRNFISIGHFFKTFTFRKLWNYIKTFFSKPSNIILLVFVVLLSAGVVVPLVLLFLDTFKVHGYNEQQTLEAIYGISFEGKKYTWHSWGAVFNNTYDFKASVTNFYEPLYKSILMSLLACLIAVAGGGILAWFITRSNLPYKKFISTVFIFPYIMPSWSIAMFWENFFKNTNYASCHYQMGFLQSITGICVPESMIYGLIPCALVLGIHYAPFAYILIGGILRNMDANLEEAATILKASRFKILRRITLPIVAPALISTILLVFASSISSFTVPEFLNKNMSFTSISISMRGLIKDDAFKAQGYVMSVVLMIFSFIILGINNALTKSRRNFTTVTGKSGQVSKVQIGRKPWVKWLVASLLIIVVSFTSIVPLITFVIESFEEVSGDLSTLTGKFWVSTEDLDTRMSQMGLSTKGIFLNTTVWASFGRSVLLSVIVAFIVGTCGILIGYAVGKNRKSPVANYVSSLAFLPYLIPALSFGAIFYSLSYQKGFGWMSSTTETGAILACIVCGSFKFLPFASRSGTNAMLQLSGEIEEAAIINGCPWWKRMTRILFPIQKSSFISCYLLPFISCMREYTLFTLLVSNVTLVTSALKYYQGFGLDQLANGINLLIVLFVIGVNLLVNKLTGASIDKGIGG